jgi:hypothetical protein
MKYVVFGNPRSSGYARFDEFVRQPLDGHEAVFLDVKPQFDETVEYVAHRPEIADGGTVIAAGGDGTLAAILNGLMKGQRRVSLKMMPLGKYNDTLWSLGQELKPLDVTNLGQAEEFAPIDLRINGDHAYYALHELCIGHLAILGSLLDQNSRASGVDGKNRGMIKTVLDYYFRDARHNPQGKLPKELHNITSVTLGRIGGRWSPRIDGRVVRGLHHGNEFAVIGEAINGNVAHDMGCFAAWTLRGIPARRTDEFMAKFDEPHDLAILIDGEIFDFKQVEEVSAKRVSSNVELYYD